MSRPPKITGLKPDGLIPVAPLPIIGPMALEDVFIARQPIFDRCSSVAGYELLFRSGPENRFPTMDTDLAASQGLERALMSFGFDSITDSKPAFVNLSRRVLLSELYTLLPPERSVIELLETVEPDADVIAACGRLKDNGYRLALDDFVYRPGFDPLLDLADFVKIDFRNEASRAPATVDRLKGRPPRLLAEKVETLGERVLAERLGFELFQGYFFCKPEMIAGKAIGPSKANYLRLLREVGQGEVEFDRVESVIRQEVAFSIRLLRYLNSAGFGWRYEVETINHALRLLGVRQLRKWVAAVATVGLAEGKPTELLVTGLLRARLAELLVEGLIHDRVHHRQEPGKEQVEVGPAEARRLGQQLGKPGPEQAGDQQFGGLPLGQPNRCHRRHPLAKLADA